MAPFLAALVVPSLKILVTQTAHISASRGNNPALQVNLPGTLLGAIYGRLLDALRQPHRPQSTSNRRLSTPRTAVAYRSVPAWTTCTTPQIRTVLQRPIELADPSPNKDTHPSRQSSAFSSIPALDRYALGRRRVELAPNSPSSRGAVTACVHVPQGQSSSAPAGRSFIRTFGKHRSGARLWRISGSWSSWRQPWRRSTARASQPPVPKQRRVF